MKFNSEKASVKTLKSTKGFQVQGIYPGFKLPVLGNVNRLWLSCDLIMQMSYLMHHCIQCPLYTIRNQ